MQRGARTIARPLPSASHRGARTGARGAATSTPPFRLPRSVLGWADRHVVADDCSALAAFAREHARDLARWQASAPELASLTPAAAFVLAVHAVAPADVQAPLYGWAEWGGYARSHAARAFAELLEAGLVRRYEQLRTVEHLTAALPEGQRLQEWTCRSGKVRRYANVWSVSTLTPAGRALVERVGWGQGVEGGELRRALVGFLRRLARALEPAFRGVRHRLGQAPEPPAGVEETPHAVTGCSLDFEHREGATPSFPQAGSLRVRQGAEMRARLAPHGAREAPQQRRAPETGEGWPKHRETAAGRGGGLTGAQAANVSWCLSRAVWEPVFARVAAPCRCGRHRRAVRAWEGLTGHSPHCPRARPGAEQVHWRRVGWRRVVRPVLTAAELWPAAWARASESERALLSEQARPVLREVWRRLEAERVARLEAERVARLEAERVARLEAERVARLEAERVARLEAERLAPCGRSRPCLCSTCLG